MNCLNPLKADHEVKYAELSPCHRDVAQHYQLCGEAGVVTVERALDELSALRRKNRLLVRVMICACVLGVITLVGNFGLTYAAIDMSRETRVSDGTLKTLDGAAVMVATDHYNAAPELGFNWLEQSDEFFSTLDSVTVQHDDGSVSNLHVHGYTRYPSQSVDSYVDALLNGVADMGPLEEDPDDDSGSSRIETVGADAERAEEDAGDAETIVWHDVAPVDRIVLHTVNGGVELGSDGSVSFVSSDAVLHTDDDDDDDAPFDDADAQNATGRRHLSQYYGTRRYICAMGKPSYDGNVYYYSGMYTGSAVTTAMLKRGTRVFTGCTREAQQRLYGQRMCFGLSASCCNNFLNPLRDLARSQCQAGVVTSTASRQVPAPAPPPRPPAAPQPPAATVASVPGQASGDLDKCRNAGLTLLFSARAFFNPRKWTANRRCTGTDLADSIQEICDKPQPYSYNPRASFLSCPPKFRGDGFTDFTEEGTCQHLCYGAQAVLGRDNVCCELREERFQEPWDVTATGVRTNLVKMVNTCRVTNGAPTALDPPESSMRTYMGKTYASRIVTTKASYGKPGCPV